MVELLCLVEQIDDGGCCVGAWRHDSREIRVSHTAKRVPTGNELDHLRDVKALLGEIGGKGVQTVAGIRHSGRAGYFRIDPPTTKRNYRARTSCDSPYCGNTDDIRT
jgi:hypothetical protein